MPRRNAMSRTDTGIPLRKDASTAELTEKQEQLLGCFLAAAVVGGVGVYATRYQNSGAIKLKLYNDGEQYTDTLNTGEDWIVLFDDYSKQLGFQAHYRGIVAAARESGALSGPESDDGGPGDTKTPVKPLRAS